MGYFSQMSWKIPKKKSLFKDLHFEAKLLLMIIDALGINKYFYCAYEKNYLLQETLKMI